MKYNCWLILGTMLSTSLLAQQVTNPAPSQPIETPAAAPAATLAPATAKTNAPAAKAGKKKSGKKKAAKAPQPKAVTKKKEALPELKTVPLVPGPAEVVATHVNVRGQPKLKSEILTRLTKGQSVTVIEEIVRNNSGPEEPSAWAKIVLPAGAHVWVSSVYINTNNATVRPKKLNLRSGPGENYSVIGRLQGGDAVKPITSKGDWTEIEAPTNTYAFMAAQYLKQEAPAAPAPATTPTEPTPATAPVATAPPAAPPAPAPTTPPPAPTTIAAAPPVAPPPTEAPAVPPPTEAPAVANVPAPIPAVTNPPPVVQDIPLPEEPPPPRIVQREGIVRGMTSIQAPSKFVLISQQDGRDIDYLFTSSKELDLRRYKGLHIIVTGEEGLDDRWPNTPILTIQKIQVVEE
jgi:hypothetical protein